MATTPLRRISALLSGLVVAGTALFGASVDAPRQAGDLEPAFASTCIGYCQHPTNAAKVFRWGLEDWHDEFEVGTLRDAWRSNHPDLVNQQNGMLTINADADTGNVVVWPVDQAAPYGRWEARVRAVEFTTSAQRYRFRWELVPAVGDSSCGANSIVMASYRPGDTRAVGAVRVLPNRQYKFSRTLDLRSRAWHAYAIEVTPDHVSWFVDTKVIRTERRSAALSGVTFRPQFSIVGDKSAQMNRSRMQMDWVRYYTLKRPNAQSIAAPKMAERVYAGGCAPGS